MYFYKKKANEKNGLIFREQASLFAQFGFDGLFLGRIDYQGRQLLFYGKIENVDLIKLLILCFSNRQRYTWTNKNP